MDHLRVLLVEDDTDLRRVVCEGLELMGHHVTTAVDARDALAKLERGDFDVICSDVAMPNGLSGIDLVERVLAANRNVRIILTSGYPRSELGPLPDGVAFLGKPYRLTQLLELLVDAGAGADVARHGLS
ncbi:MAG TPA: response regulator [Stenotrophomonas sp.]|nr:response regulator [Stenotrophomonas sp.]